MLGISRAQAARDLHVSRQMLYQYLAGESLPKNAILQRACEAWNLKLNYHDFIVSTHSFPRPSSGRVEEPAEIQLDLDIQQAIDRLRDQDLGVKILRKANGRVELQIELKFSNA